MKKLLTTFITLTTVLLLTPTAVFADENIVNKPDNSNDTTGSVDLYATKASSYSVKLPKSVDISETTTTFKVYAYGDIDAAKELKVDQGEGDHALVDVTESKADVALTVSVDDTFKYDDLGDNFDDNVYITFTIEHEGILAGSYEYELPIAISLVSASA